MIKQNRYELQNEQLKITSGLKSNNNTQKVQLLLLTAVLSSVIQALNSDYWYSWT